MSDAGSAAVVVRPPRRGELPGLAVLAGRLVRQHNAYDPLRFMHLEHVEAGYERYFASQLRSRRTLLLAAFAGARVVGYAYGRSEPRDWNLLRDECGLLHDLYVDEGLRRRGVARALVAEVLRRFRALGMPRVVLMTAAPNLEAQRFFAAVGFRPTMIEMAIELK